MSDNGDLRFFEPPTLDTAMAIVLELAAQLNEERYRRRALERVLAERGLLDPAEIERLADDEPFVAGARRELEAAMHRLLLPIIGDGPALRPLRPSAEATAGAVPDPPRTSGTSRKGSPS